MTQFNLITYKALSDYIDAKERGLESVSMPAINKPSFINPVKLVLMDDNGPLHTQLLMAEKRFKQAENEYIQIKNRYTALRQEILSMKQDLIKMFDQLSTEDQQSLIQAKLSKQ